MYSGADHNSEDHEVFRVIKQAFPRIAGRFGPHRYIESRPHSVLSKVKDKTSSSASMRFKVAKKERQLFYQMSGTLPWDGVP